MPKPPLNPPPLLSVRAAVVLLLGFACGQAVAILTQLTCQNVPATLLAGLMSGAGAIAFFHKTVG